MIAIPEVIPKPTMKWHCCTCHKNFKGPTDRTPKDGCAYCGSRQIFDCNVEPVSAEELRQILNGPHEIIVFDNEPKSTEACDK